MSDARNSSGNVRGGGAKQTGGSGRTSKGAGGQKGGSKGLDGLERVDDRNAEAKRYLQLQIMSKQLANSVRAALLAGEEGSGEARAEADYERCDIPMPDPGTAMRKLKAMKEFTEDWYDKQFREDWLDRVCQVWAKELRAEYDAFWAAQRTRDNANSKDGEAMSIEELEAMIQSPDTSAEERKRLKTKLKKRRQKANKKKPQADSKGEDDDGAEK
jgi:hypothetical protein